MADVRVIAAYEEYHRILADLSKDLKGYVTDMRETSSGVANDSRSLGNDWEGEAYDKFYGDTIQILREISSGLDKVTALTGVIDDKVPKLAKAIELLKGNG